MSRKNALPKYKDRRVSNRHAKAWRIRKALRDYKRNYTFDSPESKAWQVEVKRKALEAEDFHSNEAHGVKLLG